MAPQVLILGMPRTGTQSIGEALRTLGCANVYHMTTVGPNNHHDKWVAALEAKFEGKGPMPGRKEFDELLEDFDAVSDFPCSIFYRELMAAYPEARIILSTRSEDLWFDSMCKTLNLAFVNSKAEPSKLAKLYNLHLWANDFEANGRQAFRTHMAGVHAAAAELKRDVLEFDPSQGWETLCAFLEKPVPQGVAYPRKDMWVPYKKMTREIVAGQLTEESFKSKLDYAKEAVPINMAYIYTQKQLKKMDYAEEAVPINMAYIYTQNQLKKMDYAEEAVPINMAYIYTQNQLKKMDYAEEAVPINMAYIYTQKELGNNLATSSARSEQPVLMKENIDEGIKAAYIYTQ
ncbi:hypothetical protein LZ554_008152 [Drepanopeziza brunnea f. sp. 'monogermtubi']|nr:hypothetical protein LZ554_008152 [Drepanopeziza brunnea f. sp. 'monogermtubi']